MKDPPFEDAYFLHENKNYNNFRASKKKSRSKLFYVTLSIYRGMKDYKYYRMKHLFLVEIFMEMNVATIFEAEHYRFAPIHTTVWQCGSNVSTGDRGWKTHVLLLGDGNEIHETSRVTFSFVCLRSGFLDAPAIIENTEMQSIRMHANARRSTAHRGTDFILDYMQS